MARPASSQSWYKLIILLLQRKGHRKEPLSLESSAKESSVSFNKNHSLLILFLVFILFLCISLKFSCLLVFFLWYFHFQICIFSHVDFVYPHNCTSYLCVVNIQIYDFLVMISSEHQSCVSKCLLETSISASHRCLIRTSVKVNRILFPLFLFPLGSAILL